MSYRTDFEELWSSKWVENARPHHEIIVEFFKDKLTGKILDIGEKNPLTVKLERKYGVEIDNTREDLDCTLSLHLGGYDTIICSHVIEHLFNPLLFLWHTKRILNEGGRIYIIAPVKPYWITPARCHFHEMDDERMKALLSRAGLKIVDWQRYSVPIKWTLSIRNWLRRFYKEYSIITCESN